MRFDQLEKEALKYALKDFKGRVFLFGSRLDNDKRGGDIDIMVIPDGEVNRLKLGLQIQRRFFSRCEQTLDVIVYSKDNPFCREVMNHAKRLDIQTL